MYLSMSLSLSISISPPLSVMYNWMLLNSSFFLAKPEVVKEENNLVDENGNRLDGECSHSQRNARTPELARKFLLDAAAVFFKEQDQYCIAVLPDQATTIPLCETKLTFLKVLEVPQPLKHSLSLDAVFISQNKVNQYVEDVDVFYPFIADVDLEKGKSKKPKTKIEKNEKPFTKTMQRQMSLPVGEKIMQMLTDHRLVLPKFSFREKNVPENIGDMTSNRLRKYKRSASFNSRKVLLFSVMSCFGTMILIMLTLRVRQTADGSHHG